ncbi:MAG: hypothetical protein PHC28_09305 [Flavobacterium sp.]|uniref:hypothetical protein n=1 Tax=Flavobacterium sp. TaxID=239 RepID=UPI002622108D|nr:hypothetical protein [Flavobacterium sp.]MDD5150666.1 hypothetical protein [Flavobacterium sp.]
MSEIRKPIPTAIATIYGWAHPISGELLVSIKGLPNPNLNYKLNCPFLTQEEIRADINESIETNKEDTVEVIKPVRQKRTPKQ